MELTNLTSNGVTLLNEEQESRGNIVKENLDITSHRKSEDFMGQQVRKYKYKKVAEKLWGTSRTLFYEMRCEI